MAVEGEGGDAERGVMADKGPGSNNEGNEQESVVSEESDWNLNPLRSYECSMDMHVFDLYSKGAGITTEAIYFLMRLPETPLPEKHVHFFVQHVFRTVNQAMFPEVTFLMYLRDSRFAPWIAQQVGESPNEVDWALQSSEHHGKFFWTMTYKRN